MKKNLSTLMLSALFCIFFVTSAAALELIIVNSSKFPINTLRLTNTSTTKGYNLLDTPLMSQEAVKVRMPQKSTTWNIMAVDPNGSAVFFENIQLDKVQQVRIFGDGTMEMYR